MYNKNMKDILRHFPYEANNKYKPNKAYSYESIILNKESFKITSDPLKKAQISTFSNSAERTIETEERMVRRASRHSMAIEGVNKEVANYKEMEAKHLEATEYINSLDELDIESLNNVYNIITDNESFIDVKENEKKGNKLVRQEDIFIGGKQITLKGKELERVYKELIGLINQFLYNDNKDNVIKYAAAIHFLFEHIHPYPDFNGRIGRMIVS
jgi:Fic family protein